MINTTKIPTSKTSKIAGKKDKKPLQLVTAVESWAKARDLVGFSLGETDTHFEIIINENRNETHNSGHLIGLQLFEIKCNRFIIFLI